MANVFFAVLGLGLLGLVVNLVLKKRRLKKAGRAVLAYGASRLDKRFLLEVALYGIGFAALFYICFGQALAIFLGYGDLS